MPKKPLETVQPTRPLYRRKLPGPKSKASFPTPLFPHIDLKGITPPFYGEVDAAARTNNQFDFRAAAAVVSAVDLNNLGDPSRSLVQMGLLESVYTDDDTALIPTVKCLACMAYNDYFPEEGDIRPLVSKAIMAANPGWSGQFGPGVDGTFNILEDALPFLFDKHNEGNYDMAQMHLLQIAYRYYAELTPEAQEKLVAVLLATGRIRRPNKDDIVTSGAAPNDWSTSGFLELPLPVIGGLLGIHPKLKTLGETENHILMIHTARYLTNQLLYQRDQEASHDNRRNGSDDSPTCMRLMLYLLRNILRDDFSEYNAKNYQNETRWALQNLCSYAYDHEVRLAARMVLDYISAHIAVSSSDLRRMVPFRRRNEAKNVTTLPGGFMDIGLLDYQLGADPMTETFAMLAGNTRAFEKPNFNLIPPDNSFPVRPLESTLANDGGDSTRVVLSDYRLPPSIHDLFVNDRNRRFFQRLHRTPQDDPDITRRNCDNYEIYAGSPSYLITAGGSAAPYAIDPYFLRILPPGQDQQIGVAVTTSFIPTIQPNNDLGDPSSARDAIQFSHFSDSYDTSGHPYVMSYGVAPDFACGYGVHLPDWVRNSAEPPFDGSPRFHFIDKSSDGHSPGFYLAIYKDGDYAFLEAFDTWLHPGKDFAKFKASVLALNGDINMRDPALQGEQTGVYTTQNGSIINFLIWKDHTNFERPDSTQGAKILSINYGFGGQDGVIDPNDRLGDAGNTTNKFLNGTILNSPTEGKIEISNPLLGTILTLDMTNPDNPTRTDENGEVEEAGFHNEVWVNFDWKGENEGDFFHPFNTLAGAAAVVANRGVIKIMPGVTSETPSTQKGKRIRITAPIGGVTLGFRP
jgi:hypothetical protein